MYLYFLSGNVKLCSTVFCTTCRAQFLNVWGEVCCVVDADEQTMNLNEVIMDVFCGILYREYYRNYNIIVCTNVAKFVLTVQRLHKRCIKLLSRPSHLFTYFYTTTYEHFFSCHSRKVFRDKCFSQNNVVEVVLLFCQLAVSKNPSKYAWKNRTHFC